MKIERFKQCPHAISVNRNVDVAQTGKTETAKFVVGAKKKTAVKANVNAGGVKVDELEMPSPKSSKDKKKGKKKKSLGRLPLIVRKRKNSYMQSAPASLHASPDPDDPVEAKGN